MPPPFEASKNGPGACNSSGPRTGSICCAKQGMTAKAKPAMASAIRSGPRIPKKSAFCLTLRCEACIGSGFTGINLRWFVPFSPRASSPRPLSATTTMALDEREFRHGLFKFSRSFHKESVKNGTAPVSESRVIRQRLMLQSRDAQKRWPRRGSALSSCVEPPRSSAIPLYRFSASRKLRFVR